MSSAAPPSPAGPPGGPPTEPTVLATGPAVRPLPPADVEPGAVAGLAVTGDWGRATVTELFERHAGRGLVVLQGGRLVFEHYPEGHGADRANPCFSVTKSFTGTLAATAVAAGRIDRSAPVTAYVPELAGSGFDGAVVADVADMATSIAYTEEYDEADASVRAGWFGFGDYLAALGMAEPTGPDRPADLRALVRAVGPGPHPHGHVFAYATPVTDALGWVLERAEGRPGAELLGRLWAAIGAEQTALLLDDPAGTPLLGAGLVATTRDLARFGALLADGGVGPDGPAVDARAIEAIRDGGDPEVFARDPHYGYLAGYSYRDQWWLPGGDSRPLSAWGIYGQLLWVDPPSGVVVAEYCAGPLPSDPARDVEQEAMCRALVDAAASWS